MKVVCRIHTPRGREEREKKIALIVVIAERVLVPCLFMLGLHTPPFFVSIPLFLIITSFGV